VYLIAWDINKEILLHNGWCSISVESVERDVTAYMSVFLWNLCTNKGNISQ